MKKISIFSMVIIFMLILGCKDTTDQHQNEFQSNKIASGYEASGVDLAKARNGFKTKLKIFGPAPQDYEKAVPPKGVSEVLYSSGELKLKGWVSADPGDGKKHPAVVYLHGGWAFDQVDWQDAAPFVAAGFTLMMPMLRAENGNPGFYEGFFGEVDDAIAAGRFVANLPYVDANHIFVTGHSVGAILVVLSAMMPSNYKAAAALSGYLDMESWFTHVAPQSAVFDLTNREEIRLRNPMVFASSLRIPLILYVEKGKVEKVNARFTALAKNTGKNCETVFVEGDHMSMVASSVQYTVKWFRQQL